MRFIINFFIFGLIFYCIWYFFPGAFATLVSWATAVFDFVKNIFQGISEKTQHTPAPQNPALIIPWLLSMKLECFDRLFKRF